MEKSGSKGKFLPGGKIEEKEKKTKKRRNEEKRRKTRNQLPTSSIRLTVPFPCPSTLQWQL